MTKEVENAKVPEGKMDSAKGESLANKVWQEMGSLQNQAGRSADATGSGKAVDLPGLSVGKAANVHEDLNKSSGVEGMGSENAGKLADSVERLLKDAKKYPLEQLKTPLQRDGVSELSTGDYLVKEDGKETLFTPNGDRITVNPNGSYSIKGDVNKVTTDKHGNTTVEFADGAKVSFDDQGILSVQRDGQTVMFGRRVMPPFFKSGGSFHEPKLPGFSKPTSLDEFINKK